MAKKDPLKKIKDTLQAVYDACVEKKMKVELDLDALVIRGEDFHIKVKDFPATPSK